MNEWIVSGPSRFVLHPRILELFLPQKKAETKEELVEKVNGFLNAVDLSKFSFKEIV